MIIIKKLKERIVMRKYFVSQIFNQISSLVMMEGLKKVNRKIDHNKRSEGLERKSKRKREKKQEKEKERERIHLPCHVNSLNPGITF